MILVKTKSETITSPCLRVHRIRQKNILCEELLQDLFGKPKMSTTKQVCFLLFQQRSSSQHVQGSCNLEFKSEISDFLLEEAWTASICLTMEVYQENLKRKSGTIFYAIEIVLSNTLPNGKHQRWR
jgi:hypothetical protein